MSVRMGTRSSGTGDLELVALAGEVPYSGSNAVAYGIVTPIGATENGTASIVGGWLRGRTVVTSSNSNNAISVPMPPAGVVVYLEAQIPDGTGSTFNDGDYVAFTVSGGGTVATINDAVITAEHIVPGTITPTELQDADVVTVAELQAALGVPATDGDKGDLLFSLSGVANGTYPLDPLASWPYTITALVATGSEALTAAVQIDGVSVTGLSAVAVTAAQSITAGTAANAVVAGDVVTLVLTDIATTGDIFGKLRVTRG